MESIANYESGRTSASSIAESIELHESALESVPKEIRDKLHSLSVQVIEQDVTPQEEELLGLTPGRQALNELKSLLSELV